MPIEHKVSLITTLAAAFLADEELAKVMTCHVLERFAPRRYAAQVGGATQRW